VIGADLLIALGAEAAEAHDPSLGRDDRDDLGGEHVGPRADADNLAERER